MLGGNRGTEPLFDLGHLALHDGEDTLVPLLGDVVALPAGREELVCRSAVLPGLR
jgi:hypothetical protein